MFPIFINKGFIHIYYNYEGIYYLVAILASVVYTTYLAKKENIDVEVLYEAGFISILTALIVGRLFSFLFWEPTLLLKNPLLFFQIWKGGITVAGGVLGGLTAGYIYARVKKLHFFYHVGFIVPSIFLSQVIGRFGCFLNGDAAGVPTKSIFGLVFDPHAVAYTMTGIPSGTPIHPTQLYEMTGNFILLAFIMLTWNIKWIRARAVIWYALGYGMVRFITEFFRSDAVRWEWIKIFTTGQLIALIGITIGIGMLIWSFFNDEKLSPKEENIARLKVPVK
jgi:phosphatidylglycerol---prolipoprotein diacylglyceryl transferase